MPAPQVVWSDQTIWELSCEGQCYRHTKNKHNIYWRNYFTWVEIAEGDEMQLFLDFGDINMEGSLAQ